MPKSFAIIDCETTGRGKHDRIVEIAIITVDPKTWETTDEFDTLINPERDVSASHIHGVTASMVELAPTFSEIAATLAHRLHNSVLIAHNLPFDIRMLRQEFAKTDITFNSGRGMCTWEATRAKLIVACQRYKITLDAQHRALADARATAVLAKKVLSDNTTGSKPATFNRIPKSFDTRSLRRESSDMETSNLARIVSLAPYPCTDADMLQYLEALDWVLDDNYIDEEEQESLLELASTLGISDDQRHAAHRSYLLSIIAAAERDNIITDAENKCIKQISKALGITDIPVPEVTQLSSMSDLRPGCRVCFTGEAIVEGEQIPRSALEEIAASVGMQPVSSVTKKGCDLLVAADASSRSGKARTAIRFNIPILAVTKFLDQTTKNKFNGVKHRDNLST